MNKKIAIVEKPKKLLSFLQDFGFSFSDASKMLRNKDVRIDGVVTKDNVLLCSGQSVTFFFADDMLKKKFDVLFQSDEAVVIYKRAGIESERSLEETLKAIAVHRLDRNTEGLMVYAKNAQVAEKLQEAFKNQKVHKLYVAEVVGKFDFFGTVEAYLLKDSEKSEVKIFDTKKAGSVPIATRFETLKSGKESSLVKVELLTGKTHQIRAQLAHLGHPIIGDGKYGKNEINKKFGQKRQKLACFCLKFDKIGIKSLDGKQFERLPEWLKDVDVKMF